MIPIFEPVLADLEAIIKVIIFLVILGSGFVKMFRESKEVQQQAERRKPRPRPQPAGDVDLEMVEARGAGQPAPQQAIRSEVEEFLSRVGGDAEADQPQRQRQPRIEVLDDAQDSGFDVDERPRQSRSRSLPSQRKPARPPLAEAASTTGIERGETVAEHVDQHLKRNEFAERASHLGEQLSQTDERLEARLHKKFDHGLGSLAARREAREADDLAKQGASTDTSMADSVIQALSTPLGVQQAVIMSEVLTRPTDRW